METLIRSIQYDELSALLDLYQHLSPTDSQPDEESFSLCGTNS